jgi:hypothetical protein
MQTSAYFDSCPICMALGPPPMAAAPAPTVATQHNALYFIWGRERNVKEAISQTVVPTGITFAPGTYHADVLFDKAWVPEAILTSARGIFDSKNGALRKLYIAVITPKGEFRIVAKVKHMVLRGCTM